MSRRARVLAGLALVVGSSAALDIPHVALGGQPPSAAPVGETFSSGSSGEPRVRGPELVRRGRVVRVAVNGFPPGDRVRVQFSRHFRVPANCCASFLFPRVGKPGLRLGPDGARRIRVRVPRRYAQCTSVRCDRPGFRRYRRGQRVNVGVSSIRRDAYAQYVATIR